MPVSSSSAVIDSRAERRVREVTHRQPVPVVPADPRLEVRAQRRIEEHPRLHRRPLLLREADPLPQTGRAAPVVHRLAHVQVVDLAHRVVLGQHPLEERPRLRPLARLDGRDDAHPPVGQRQHLAVEGVAVDRLRRSGAPGRWPSPSGRTRRGGCGGWRGAAPRRRTPPRAASGSRRCPPPARRCGTRPRRCLRGIAAGRGRRRGGAGGVAPARARPRASAAPGSGPVPSPRARRSGPRRRGASPDGPRRPGGRGSRRPRPRSGRRRGAGRAPRSAARRRRSTRSTA